MNKLNYLVFASLCLATLSFSPLAVANDAGPRTGPTVSYYMGTSKLQNVSGFDTPTSNGFQLGYQWRYLGLTFGQNHLGGFATSSGSVQSKVDVDSNEILVNFRMYADYASLFLYAGVSQWGFTNTTVLSQNSTSGTSPVVGLGFKLGNKLGLLMTAMYYKDITDSDVLNLNLGINF
jgi:hypothetical protein